MERLTSKSTPCQPEKCVYCIERSNCYRASCDEIYKALEKLAAYEELAEQGRLITLPCAVRSKIYAIEKNIRTNKWEIKVYTASEFFYRGFDVDVKVAELLCIAGCYSHGADFGKTVFLTEPESHQALMRKNCDCEDCVISHDRTCKRIRDGK